MTVVKFKTADGRRCAYVRLKTDTGGECEFGVERRPPVVDAELAARLKDMLRERGVKAEIEVRP